MSFFLNETSVEMARRDVLSLYHPFIHNILPLPRSVAVIFRGFVWNGWLFSSLADDINLLSKSTVGMMLRTDVWDGQRTISHA